jgi:DNA polymerase-3 subunit epsilon
MRFLIGDTETTGLGPDRAAVEIALIEIDPNSLETIGEVSSIVNPGKPIDPTAAAIHGITDEEAAKHPTLAQYIQDTLDGPLEGDIVLIGYRVAFDLPLLRPFGNIVRTFDVLPLAQNLVTDSTNHKLQTLREHFGLPEQPAHRALGDCHTTLSLLRILLPMSGRTLLQHCATGFQVIHKMPFGKYTGTSLLALPADYKKWLLKLPDLDTNLRISLELFSKLDMA